MNVFPVEPQSYKVHVDASYDPDTKSGKIAWVVYLHDELISTNILPKIRRNSVRALEELVFKIVNQIYHGGKIYTDSQEVWNEWKGKNKNRIYLINRKDNLADDLLRGNEIPKTYQKIPTFKFEYVKVQEIDEQPKSKLSKIKEEYDRQYHQITTAIDSCDPELSEMIKNVDKMKTSFLKIYEKYIEDKQDSKEFLHQSEEFANILQMEKKMYERFGNILNPLEKEFQKISEKLESMK